MTPEQAMGTEALGGTIAAMTFRTSMIAAVSESVKKGVDSHSLDLSHV